jgi:GntR family transcriptional regulator
LDGSFTDGDMLPSVRALAAEQGVNPLTVAKAYQSFQDEGLVAVKRGVGMFVSEGATEKLRAKMRQEFIEQIWPPVAEQMRRIGVNPLELLQAELA